MQGLPGPAVSNLTYCRMKKMLSYLSVTSSSACRELLEREDLLVPLDLLDQE